jgi:hemoglobin
LRKCIAPAARKKPPRRSLATAVRLHERTGSNVPEMSEDPTIYEWAGGEDAFARWLNAFYDLVEEDAEIVALFGGKVSEEHRRHVTEWWSEVMGGPARYSEDHGGYEHMLAQHRGLGITPDMRLRFVTLLSRAADIAELPDDPEFRAALMSYAEWGTRLALHNSQPGVEVQQHAPIPRWGWGVAPPYRP